MELAKILPKYHRSGWNLQKYCQNIIIRNGICKSIAIMSSFGMEFTKIFPKYLLSDCGYLTRNRIFQKYFQNICFWNGISHSEWNFPKICPKYLLSEWMSRSEYNFPKLFPKHLLVGLNTPNISNLMPAFGVLFFKPINKSRGSNTLSRRVIVGEVEACEIHKQNKLCLAFRQYAKVPNDLYAI